MRLFGGHGGLALHPSGIAYRSPLARPLALLQLRVETAESAWPGVMEVDENAAADDMDNAPNENEYEVESILTMKIKGDGVRDSPSIDLQFRAAYDSL